MEFGDVNIFAGRRQFERVALVFVGRLRVGGEVANALVRHGYRCYALEEALPERVTIADLMRAHAADAVKHARSQYGIDLDYSEASLQQIDRMLDHRTGGAVFETDTLTAQEQEELWVYCKMIGGYVGEVIIRNLGGTWQIKEINPSSSSVKLMAAGKIEGSPPDSVWRTLTEPNRSMTSYYCSLRAMLGHGDERTENRVKFVKLPPLSSEAPQAGPRKKPWWRFW